MWRKKKVLPDFKPYEDPTDTVRTGLVSAVFSLKKNKQENLFPYKWRKAEASRHKIQMLERPHRRIASSALAQRNWEDHVLFRPQSFDKNEIHRPGPFGQDNHIMFDRAFRIKFDPHNELKCTSPLSHRIPLKEVNNESSHSAMSLLNCLAIPEKDLNGPANNAKSAILELPSIEETEDIWVKNHERELIYSDPSPIASVRSFSDSCASEESDFQKYFSHLNGCEASHTSNPSKIRRGPSSFIFPTNQCQEKVCLKKNEDINHHSKNFNFSIVRSPCTPLFVNLKMKGSPDFQHCVETGPVKEAECSEVCEDDFYIPDELSESPWPDSGDNSCKGSSSTIISDDKVRKYKQIQILQPCLTDPDEELMKLMNSI